MESLRHTELPLTEAELGIWLGHQRTGHGEIYNTAECLILRGVLDMAAFIAAIEETLKEATALHAAFPERQGRPYRLQLSPPELRLQVEDLSAQGEPERALFACAAGELAKCRAIERGELFTHRVFRLGEERFAWLQVVHHIALDGYGFNLISRRVAERYTARLAQAEPAPLSPGFASIGPVVEQDRAYQASEMRASDRTFWLEELGAASAISWGEASELTPAAAIRVRSWVSPELAARIREEAKRLKCEWSELLLAALATLLSLGSDRSSFSLGLPVMLRLGTPALNVPCMTMNIVPLPVHLQEEDRLASVAQQIRATMKRQRRHLRYRYEHAKADRGAGSARLFGPTVNIMPFDFPARFGDCEAFAHNLSAGPVEDISFGISPRKGGFELLVDGHPELFCAESLEQQASQFVELLGLLVEEPELSLRELRERGVGTSVLELAARSAASPEVTPLEPLAELRRRALEEPEAQALVQGDRIFTCSQLYHAVLGLADELRERGVQPGDRIALELPRSVEAIVVLLAAHLVGAAYVALDPSHPQARQQLVLDQVEPRLLVQSANSLHSLGIAGDRVLSVGVDFWESWRQRGEGAQQEFPPIEGERAAYIVFTSGSTGQPKGVVIQRSALAHFLGSARIAYGFSSSDRVLQFAPLTFDASVEEIFLTVATGGTLVLRDDSWLESMRGFLHRVERARISVLDLPTAFWHELVLALEEQELSVPACVRLVIIGGEAAQPTRVRTWQRRAPGVRLLNTYGPSEATVVATAAELTDWSGVEHAVPIGRSLPGMDAVLLDDSARLVRAVNHGGELYLLGASLAAGYLGRADWTEARFVTLPDGRRAYRTGDRARYSPRGDLIFEGRVDDEIKLSGYRIVPAEIEAALSRHEEVRACLVRGEKDRAGGVRLVAEIEGDVARLDAPGLRAFLSVHLPLPMIPSVFHVRAELPRTSHGKIDRVRLVELAEAEPRESTEVRVRLSPEEEQVAEVWRAVLGVATVRPEDDFFAIGGDSLKVIQIANRLSALGSEVTVAQIFRCPTLRDQARWLGSTSTRTDQESAALQPFVPTEVSLPEAWGRVDRRESSVARALPTPSSWTRVLLTGASGFVGIHLLEALLSSTSARVVCLVRGEDEADARARVLGAAARQELDLGRWADRLELLPLDGARLTREQLLERVRPCDVILHAAAQVSLTRDYASLLGPNVYFTRELLGAALAWGSAFHFVSTVAVTPHADQVGLIQEEFYPLHEGLRDGYQRSKWQAEQLCAQAGQRGLSVSVHRLGRVLGARRHPVLNPTDLVWRIARAATRLGAWPDLPVSEPWTPVDTVARTLLELASTPRAGEPGARVYHLVQSGNVQLSRVHAALRELGHPLERLPLSVWLERLEGFEDDEARATLAFFQLARSGGAPTELPERAVPLEFSWAHVREALPHADTRPTDDALLLEYCRRAEAQGILVRERAESV